MIEWGLLEDFRLFQRRKVLPIFTPLTIFGAFTCVGTESALRAVGYLPPAPEECGEGEVKAV